MNKQEIEELLKDRLKEAPVKEGQTYREYFLREFKQKLRDQNAYKDMSRASDLYKKIGEEIKQMLDHYTKSFQEVKIRLRKQLKNTQKFNWLQNLHNDSLQLFNEERLDEIISYYQEDKNLGDEEEIKKLRSIVDKCERKFQQFRVTAFENLEKMLSQVFFKFKRIAPLTPSSSAGSSSSSSSSFSYSSSSSFSISSKSCFNLRKFSEGCFFSITQGGKKASIRRKEDAQVEENSLEKQFSDQLDAAVVVGPTQILLREKGAENVQIWDTVSKQLSKLQLDAKTISKIKVLSNQLIAFSTANQSKVSLMTFNSTGNPQFYENSLNVDKNEEDEDDNDAEDHDQDDNDDQDEEDENAQKDDDTKKHKKGKKVKGNLEVLEFTEVQHQGQLYLAVAYSDQNVRLFQIRGKNDSHPQWRTLRRTPGSQSNTLVQMNENQLASGGDQSDQTIQIWNLQDQNNLSPAQYFRGHIGQLIKLEMLTPYLLVSASQDNTLRIWNARSGTQLRQFRLHQQINDFICLQDTIIISTESGVFYRVC